MEAQAAALNAAGKTHDAAEAYMNAGQAYATEGNSRAAAQASGKAADLYEKEADALLQEIDHPTPAPAAPVQARIRPVARPTPIAAVAPAIPAAPMVAAPRAAKVLSLPPLSPKSGAIIGRIVDENGAVIPHVTLHYSGFEDGKLIVNNSENVGGDVKGVGGTYAIKVPPGAYRISAYATYVYQGRTYNFEMEPLNPPNNHDFNGLGLDYLKNGLVRDFVLKLTAKKLNAWEDTESGYINAYYGGRVDFDCSQVEYIIGGGHAIDPPLSSAAAYPSDSRLHVTLTPQGPRVDGSTGEVIQVDLRLGDNGSYKFNRRGVFPGMYTATASLTTPAGETIPLRLTTNRARTVLHGSPDGYDTVVIDWKPSATVDFIPYDLGIIPIMGVRPVGLFLGK